MRSIVLLCTQVSINTGMNRYCNPPALYESDQHCLDLDPELTEPDPIKCRRYYANAYMDAYLLDPIQELTRLRSWVPSYTG